MKIKDPINILQSIKIPQIHVKKTPQMYIRSVKGAAAVLSQSMNFFNVLLNPKRTLSVKEGKFKKITTSLNLCLYQSESIKRN